MLTTTEHIKAKIRGLHASAKRDSLFITPGVDVRMRPITQVYPGAYDRRIAELQRILASLSSS